MEIVSQSQQLDNARSSGELQSPGDTALRLLNAGKATEAKAAARAIIASRDPYAISSLSQYVAAAGATVPVTAGAAPAELRSIGFSIAACKLGLECGPGSLTALLLCANSGECAGSVADRYLSELSSQAERDAVLKESARVIDAIRSGDMAALAL